MKHITTFLSFFFIAFLCIHSRAQVPVCINGLNASLNVFGELTLYPSDIDGGSYDYDTIYMYPSFFTCADIGTNTVVLVVAQNNGNADSCITSVNILDEVPPVAICEGGITVQLDENGEFVLDPQDLDDGSYDACTAVTLSTVPTTIYCGDPNPVLVQLVVEDNYSNTTICMVEVYHNAPPSAPALACSGAFTVAVYDNIHQAVTITPEMILVGGPYPCINAYEVTLSLNGVDLPGDEVGSEHIGQVLIVPVTRKATTMPGKTTWLIASPIKACRRRTRKLPGKAQATAARHPIRSGVRDRATNSSLKLMARPPAAGRFRHRSRQSGQGSARPRSG